MGLDVAQLQTLQTRSPSTAARFTARAGLLPEPPVKAPTAESTQAFIETLLENILTPEVRAAAEAINARAQGWEEPFWSWVEENTGQQPDALLHSAFDAYMPQWEKLPILIAYGLLHYHRQRLENPDQAKWYANQTEYVYKRLKKNEEWELMQALESYGHSKAERLARLKAEIPGALFTAEAEGLYVGHLVSKYLISRVERIIVNECRPDLHRTEGGRAATLARKEAAAAQKRLDDQKLNEHEYMEAVRNLHLAKEHKAQARESVLAAYTMPSSEEACGLAEFKRKENALTLRKLIERANLTPRQLEVLVFDLRGFEKIEIASELGVGEQTVKTHLKNTRSKLRRAAGQ